MSDATRFPVIERIAQLLAARLEKLRGGTFNTRAAKVVRAAEHFKGTIAGELTGSFTIEDRLVLLTQGVPEKVGVWSGNPPTAVYTNTFQVTFFISPSPNDKTPTEQLVNIFAADIQKAVATPEDDADDWAQFDGLAGYAEILPPIHFDSTDWWGGSVPVAVSYGVSETDPYDSRSIPPTP